MFLVLKKQVLNSGQFGCFCFISYILHTTIQDIGEIVKVYNMSPLINSPVVRIMGKTQCTIQ